MPSCNQSLGQPLSSRCQQKARSSSLLRLGGLTEASAGHGPDRSVMLHVRQTSPVSLSLSLTLSLSLSHSRLMMGGMSSGRARGVANGTVGLATGTKQREHQQTFVKTVPAVHVFKELFASTHNTHNTSMTLRCRPPAWTCPRRTWHRSQLRGLSAFFRRIPPRVLPSHTRIVRDCLNFLPSRRG